MPRKRTLQAAPFVFICILFFFRSVIYTPVLAADPHVIKLKSGGGAEFQILRVTNRLLGDMFSDEFLEMITVKISNGDTVYYKGTVGQMPVPVTEAIPIAENSRVLLDVSFSFDRNADNRFQGVSYLLLWEFEAFGDTKTQIDMQDGSVLHSNLNINPGDTYGFSLIVENGKPPPIAPPVIPPVIPPDPWPVIPPVTPPGPSPPKNEDSSDPDESGDKGRPNPPDETDKPENPGVTAEPGEPTAPGDPGDPEPPDSGGGSFPGVQTGDFSTAAQNGVSLPLLIASVVFLIFIICVFIRIISEERKRQAEK